jgi:outer membrane lipoprotein-sorting protein
MKLFSHDGGCAPKPPLKAVRLALPVAVSLAALVAVAPVSADPDGDKAVAAMDAVMNKARTLIFDYDIVNKESGKDERTLAMTVKLKGEKRYTEFSAPADMKGTKVLILSPTQMYVYLPAFGKVRRIASHTKDQGFLGLSFSQDDMATTAYGLLYTGTVSGDGITLTPKPGVETPYAKIEVSINKDHGTIAQLKYFNGDGNNVKTETRTNYSCDGDVCTPGELKMVDNVKGNWTKLVAKSRKVNEEISDDVFSQRNLGE